MNETTLSPAARALVHAGRPLYAPTAADTARVHAKLAAKLALPVTTVLAAKAAAAGIAGKLAVVAVIVVVGVGGAGVLSSRAPSTARPRTQTARIDAPPGPRPTATLRPVPSVPLVMVPPARPSVPRAEPEPPQPSPAMAPAEVPRSVSLHALEALEEGAPMPFAATPVAPPPPAVEPPSDEESAPTTELDAIGIHEDSPGLVPSAPLPPIPVVPRTPRAWTLFGEQQFLQAARIDMATGHPDRALLLLDEQAARFPHGVLRVARHAVRTLVLCMVGRTPEARIEAAAVLRREPVGPHADMVRGSCAGPTID